MRILVGWENTEEADLLKLYLGVGDNGGDFVFLTISTLESAVDAARAEEAKKLAGRLREEMDGVRKLQESIIPHGLKTPPGYKLAARYEPSQVTVMGERPVVMAGGDYYDIFRPDDNTLIVLIGDASGHGLKACMSIMAMHTLVRMIMGNRYRDTGEFVAEINQRLCDNQIVQSDGGFITLLYAAIDTQTHTMTWTSAGHPLAQMHDLKTNTVTQIGSEADSGLPLAVAPDLEYPACKMVLPPDCRVLLYSDGLTDAFPQQQTAGAGHKAFGIEGLQRALRESPNGSVDEALDHLFKASHEFTGGSGLTTNRDNTVGHGTCWVVEAEKRLVITNQHVVLGHDTCKVAFPRCQSGNVLTNSGLYPQSDYIPGKVLARDSKRDLALVRLDRLPKGAKALVLAPKGIMSGQEIWAIGNSSMSGKVLN